MNNLSITIPENPLLMSPLLSGQRSSPEDSFPMPYDLSPLGSPNGSLSPLHSRISPILPEDDGSFFFPSPPTILSNDPLEESKHQAAIEPLSQSNPHIIFARTLSTQKDWEKFINDMDIRLKAYKKYESEQDSYIKDGVLVAANDMMYNIHSQLHNFKTERKWEKLNYKEIYEIHKEEREDILDEFSNCSCPEEIYTKNQQCELIHTQTVDLKERIVIEARNQAGALLGGAIGKQFVFTNQEGNKSHYFFLDYLYSDWKNHVEREYSGIGTALIEELYHEVSRRSDKNNGFIFLLSLDHAISFYEKFGFIEMDSYDNFDCCKLQATTFMLYEIDRDGSAMIDMCLQISKIQEYFNNKYFGLVDA